MKRLVEPGGKHFSLFIAFAVTFILAPATFAQQDKASVYKIAEAGVQFTLPAGWEVEKDKNGTVTASKKETDAYVVIVLSVLPADASMTLDKEFAAFSEGVLEGVKKDWKNYKSQDVHKDSQSGMDLISQSFDGSYAELGGDLEGLVIVIDSPKPIGIFAYRTKKHSETLDKESGGVLSSFKKID